MLKKLTISICLIFTALIATNIQAQEVKIGFVDPLSIMDVMPEMKAIEQRLSNFEAKEVAKLRQQNAELTQAATLYEQKKDVISAAAKKAEEDRILKMRDDFNKSQQAANAAIQQRSQELFGPLQAQIGTAITEVAQEMGLSYVINTRTRNNDAIILYVSEEYGAKFDITSAVMTKLGIN